MNVLAVNTFCRRPQVVRQALRSPEHAVPTQSFVSTHAIDPRYPADVPDPLCVAERSRRGGRPLAVPPASVCSTNSSPQRDPSRAYDIGGPGRWGLRRGEILRVHLNLHRLTGLREDCPAHVGLRPPPGERGPRMARILAEDRGRKGLCHDDPRADTHSS